MSARSPSSICSSVIPSRSKIARAAYTLHLSLADNRLVFTVGDDMRPIVHVMLSLSPFRRLVKDYFLMCESYYQAVKTAPPSRIEAIDMVGAACMTKAARLSRTAQGQGRHRHRHSETAVHLICALHWKG